MIDDDKMANSPAVISALKIERTNELISLTIAPMVKDNTRKLNIIIGLQYLTMTILLGVTIITCAIILSTLSGRIANEAPLESDTGIYRVNTHNGSLWAVMAV